MHGIMPRLTMLCAILVCCCATPCSGADLELGFDVPVRAVVPDDAAQLVLVISQDWGAVPAVLRRFERAPANSPSTTWTQAGPDVPVVLGRTGLAWGRGLHDAAEPWRLVQAPFKQEGDGKAPAGVFSLSAVFGYERGELATTTMPLLVLDKGQLCVDDYKSRHYNTIIDGDVEQDWDSAEIMRREDGLYRYGVVVAHNAAPVRPGDGSCIFMHIERGQGAPTAGCTAMQAARVLELALWLDAAARPVLVQLPQAAYEALRVPWNLP